MHFSLFGLETRRQTDIYQYIACQDGPLSSHARKQEVNVFFHKSPAVTFTGRNGIASRGQISAHTSQPVHMLASISALGRWVFMSSSSLFKMAGHPRRKQRVQPLHSSDRTSSGTHRFRTSGSRAQGSTTISTEGSSNLTYSLRAFSMAFTSYPGTE